jgi:YbbR domain-containing protein
MLRWIVSNLRTFFLAIVLAMAVWVSAVTAEDPDEVRTYPNPIQLEIVGQSPSLVIIGSYPKQVEVTLRAPRSVWDKLTSNPKAVRAILDLSSLSAGEHTVNLQIQVAERPVRIVSVNPSSVTLSLEPLITRTLTIEPAISGEPAIGYKAGDVTLDPKQVAVSGPESLVNQIARARIVINQAGVREDIDQSMPVQILDQNNTAISGLTVNPETVHVTVPVSQQGGYRDVAVKVVVQGLVASGYRLTNISVFPPVVTLYSSDPQVVNSLPGVVETAPLSLDGAKEDITTRLALSLPASISVVGEQNVLVQVGISPIQSSLTISNKKVEVIGLPNNLAAQISPETVDVILSGPLPLLDALSSQDVRVIVDVTGLEAGTHQLTPKVEILVSNISVESILPATLEVVLTPSGSISSTPVPTTTP